MGLHIKCNFDSRELNVFLNAINAKRMRKVVAKSLNRTGTTVRKEAAREIRGVIRLKASEIKKALPIQRKPRGNEPIDSQELVIGAGSKPISLSKFKPKQVAGGARVNITGKPQVIRHAFVRQMGNASRANVWQRGRVLRPGIRVRRGKNKSELPIMKQAYKGIHKILDQFKPKLAQLAAKRFGIEFQRNFEHYVGGA